MVIESSLVVKKLKFWATTAIVVMGCGFFAAMYLNRYANAADLEKLDNKQTANSNGIASKLEDHILNETERLVRVEEMGRRLDEDAHWTREQLQRIADRVGASRVATPSH